MSSIVSSHGGFEPFARAPKSVAGVARTGGVAAPTARKGAFASFLARWVETYQMRQQERALEALMDLDPRVRAEIASAQARANGGY